MPKKPTRHKRVAKAKKKTPTKRKAIVLPARGATVLVGEQVVGELDVAVASTGNHWCAKQRVLRKVFDKTKRSTRSLSAATCAALAAVGHQQRGKLLSKLLEGPATYQALKKVTKLSPGPLYHHINQLRLAKLIFPKQRDLYELTRGGRNLILIAQAIGPLIGDARRRPMGR